ncbi:MAG: glycosyltransferase [Nanobdellota archaeon]
MLTHNREILSRVALESVFNQDYDGEVEILIGADRCPYADSFQNMPRGPKRNLKIIHFNHDIDGDISVRLAKMRNYCCSVADSDYVAFLDDDNIYLTYHLSSLANCLEKYNADAVHAWRKVIDKDGNLVELNYFPWSTSNFEEEYNYFCKQGVIHPGGSVIRDTLVLPDGNIGMVDTSSWLFKLKVFNRIKFPEYRSEQDKQKNHTEDDLLLVKILRENLTIKSTKIPSLAYRLGGYSNA